MSRSKAESEESQAGSGTARPHNTEHYGFVGGSQAIRAPKRQSQPLGVRDPSPEGVKATQDAGASVGAPSESEFPSGKSAAPTGVTATVGSSEHGYGDRLRLPRGRGSVTASPGRSHQRAQAHAMHAHTQF